MAESTWIPQLQHVKLPDDIGKYVICERIIGDSDHLEGVCALATGVWIFCFSAGGVAPGTAFVVEI